MAPGGAVESKLGSNPSHIGVTNRKLTMYAAFLARVVKAGVQYRNCALAWLQDLGYQGCCPEPIPL